jgi:hypothetical protein
VNSYITKPVTFASLVTVVSTLQQYWFEIVELPPEKVQPHGERSDQGPSRG